MSYLTAHQGPGADARVENFQEKVAFIWSVADLLRGDYKQSEYGKVILPMTVLRRLDSVLEPTKDKVLARTKELKGRLQNVDPVMTQITGREFYNTSPFTFPTLLDDPANVGDNLRTYILGFDTGTRDVIAKFEFEGQIRKLEGSNLLYKVVSKFCDMDLHPDTVSNLEMGYVYEELVRKFSELSNETAGEHFTPREVIRLMVNILLADDRDLLTKKGTIKTLYDPACGTGGMLSVAEDYLRELNPDATLRVAGQELNAETYAVCRSDMMLKGQAASDIAFGNSFTQDAAEGERFDYLLANPPFGVEWKKVQERVREEHDKQGYEGRFGAGLPRINDGSLLFLQHMISKMKRPEDGGSRLAIVFNASPLFTGGAGSGESEIRRWIIENDWLEAIVGLPDQLFYNTGISTYFWVLTNRKAPERKGKVQLVDARELWKKMRKSLGEKRKTITGEQIAEITNLYSEFEENDRSKIFRNEEFGYRRITVERPLRVRWEVTDETLGVLRSSKAVSKLDDDVAKRVVQAVEKLKGTSATERDVFTDKTRSVLADIGKLGRPIERAVLDATMVRDSDAPVVRSKEGEPELDAELRDHENVPLTEAVTAYVEREVLPFVLDAWVDESRTRVGYEIPFTRRFYKFVPPRPLEKIDAEIRELEEQILKLLREATD
ncbi:MAG: class I SAM-dependent DNA methyltransferase [Actinomycetota bacterium]